MSFDVECFTLYYCLDNPQQHQPFAFCGKYHKKKMSINQYLIRAGELAGAPIVPVNAMRYWTFSWTLGKATAVEAASNKAYVYLQDKTTPLRGTDAVASHGAVYTDKPTPGLTLSGASSSSNIVDCDL